MRAADPVASDPLRREVSVSGAGTTQADVVVVGSGPAGLAIARATAAAGLRTRVVTPCPEARWQRSFGAWLDEIDALPEARAVAQTWAGPVVHTDPLSRHEIFRRYARFDVEALQSLMLRRARLVGVDFHHGMVAQIIHQDDRSAVQLRSGQVLQARVVVDASGGRSPFVRFSGRQSVAWQTAYGLRARVRWHPWPRGEMVFMDFRSLPGDLAGRRPTFLYAMPLSATEVFVEETSLVARPALPIRELRSRLQARLDHMGLHLLEVLEEERCTIAMGGSLPDEEQRLVAFGSAANMVHPASGYMLSRVLQTAPAVADAIKTGLSQGGAKLAARAAWREIWSRPARRKYDLYRFGMETLCSLDADRTRALFDTFFRLPDDAWQGFLSDGLSPDGVAKTMLSVFSEAAPALRWRLLEAGLGRSGITAIRSAAGI
ncbi:MAG: lycopene cyclase family protein [Deltaproteobacteria bacterium]|nr:MAG: lycopene cyclase family protein [Deltaproteobacteria bacterium]